MPRTELFLCFLALLYLCSVNKITLLLLTLFILSCQGKKQESKENLPFWKQIILDDIDSLNKQSIWIDHNTQIGETVENSLIKTQDWNDLLSPFLNIEHKKNTIFTETTDSSGDISIQSFVNKDTNAVVQTISLMKNKGHPNVLEIKTNEKSSLSKRECTYSYQPQKAFGIIVNEKYLWTEPKIISINAAYLKQ